MTDVMTTVYFLIEALILLVVLVFLYKLMLAIGRLDRRLEQLARHLRDLNLYELQPEEDGVFGEATEVESGADATDGDVDAGEEGGATPASGRRASRAGTDTTPLRFRPGTTSAEERS